MTWRVPGVVLLLIASAWAADAVDERGWHSGTRAAGAPRVLSLPEAPPKLDLPARVARLIQQRAFLWYFSPTCPHCQAVAPEVEALAKRLPADVAVIGVASSHSDRADIEAFERTFQISHRIVHDVDGTFGTAIGATMTPSSLFVARTESGLVVQDLWYPFSPGTGPLVEMRAATSPWAPFTPHRYMGTTTCAACHVEETDAWLLTHHSVAWRTLVTRGDHERAECTGCHVTGNGKPGGWTPGADTLVDVGCEACHGPGGPHDGHREDARQACEGCHDAKHSISFNLDRALPHIDHFAASGMEDADWRQRRRALAAGEAERPLTRFAPGNTVGAAACAGCHVDEHAQWAGGPHAAAFRNLSAKNEAASRDVTCARCHATARSAPLDGSTLEALRTEDGVGCESCHGPGERHVVSGGAPGTIEGLGDDCPVCVIEAVCTNCHTREWDPDWSLDVALPQVKHKGE